MNVLPGINVNDHFTVVMAILALILGSARFTRLVTNDKWPPVVKFRIWWDAKTEKEPGEGWNILFHCPWCFAPYVVAVNMAAGLLSDLHPAWWIVNGWLAASYAASWVVFHDED